LELVYKLCHENEWRAAETLRSFVGSEHDQRDGFIHFSTAAQLQATAEKYFARQSDLLLVTVAADALGAALRYEPSRGGDLFPHLYGPLDFNAVVAVDAIPLNENGDLVLPERPTVQQNSRSTHA
jgi:uncharacterized protein (DUF952 family)